MGIFGGTPFVFPALLGPAVVVAPVGPVPTLAGRRLTLAPVFGAALVIAAVALGSIGQAAVMAGFHLRIHGPEAVEGFLLMAALAVATFVGPAFLFGAAVLEAALDAIPAGDDEAGFGLALAAFTTAALVIPAVVIAAVGRPSIGGR